MFNAGIDINRPDVGSSRQGGDDLFKQCLATLHGPMSEFQLSYFACEINVCKITERNRVVGNGAQAVINMTTLIRCGFIQNNEIFPQDCAPKAGGQNAASATEKSEKVKTKEKEHKYAIYVSSFQYSEALFQVTFFQPQFCCWQIKTWHNWSTLWHLICNSTTVSCRRHQPSVNKIHAFQRQTRSSAYSWDFDDRITSKSVRRQKIVIHEAVRTHLSSTVVAIRLQSNHTHNTC
jgi:hypothetical protein